MTQYRDDPLPSPFPLPGNEVPGEPVPVPDIPTAEPGEPDVPDFPEGGGAGGDFDRSDDPDEPDPDFDGGPDYGYNGPDDYAGPEQEAEYRMNQRGNRCMMARHNLAEANDQIEANDRAIEFEQERLERDRRELLECGSTTVRFAIWDGRRRLRYVTCEEFFLRQIQQSEQRIERLRNRMEEIRATLPRLEKRVREECEGS